MRVRLRRAWPAASVLALLLLAPGPEGSAGAGVFNPQTFTLKNGMAVVVIPNHRVPVVTHMVWYKVGSADEPPGKSGTAHFLEHLMFKGTRKLASGEFSRILARNGGRENAFTSQDYTGYFQSISVDRLEMVMEMEADRMTNLVFDAKKVEPERQVIFEERRNRTGNNPSALLAEYVNATLFLNHPYRRPIIGWEHEVRGLTIADLMSFYRRWYVPNNAILVVAGDITAEKLRPLAEKTYGRIPAAPALTRARPGEPPHRTARRVTLKDPRVRQPSWSRTFLAPSYTEGATENAYALQVLAEILGGATGPLYRSLVVEQKLAGPRAPFSSPTGWVRAPSGFTPAPGPAFPWRSWRRPWRRNWQGSSIKASPGRKRGGPRGACRPRPFTPATPWAPGRGSWAARSPSASPWKTWKAGPSASARSRSPRSTQRLGMSLARRLR